MGFLEAVEYRRNNFVYINNIISNFLCSLNIRRPKETQPTRISTPSRREIARIYTKSCKSSFLYKRRQRFRCVYDA